jgi:hypothetical protein
LCFIKIKKILVDCMSWWWHNLPKCILSQLIVFFFMILNLANPRFLSSWWRAYAKILWIEIILFWINCVLSHKVMKCMFKDIMRCMHMMQNNLYDNDTFRMGFNSSIEKKNWGVYKMTVSIRKHVLRLGDLGETTPHKWHIHGMFKFNHIPWRKYMTWSDDYFSILQKSLLINKG